MNPTELRAARSLTFWFTDLKSIALIACIAGVLSLPLPIWNAIQTIAAATAPTNDFWRLAEILALVLMTLFTVIIPVFYFALYHDEAILYFPKRFRLLALIAAFTFVVMVLTTLPAWIRSLTTYLAAFDWSIGAASVLVFVRDPRTIGYLSTLLGELSNIAYVLVLIAIFRRADESQETGVHVSRMLRVMTKMAVIAWGLVLLTALLGLLLTPYSFYTLRNDALQIGRRPPAFGDMLVRQIRTVIEQACLIAAPYIIYKSLRERVESPANAQSGPDLIVSGV